MPIVQALPSRCQNLFLGQDLIKFSLPYRGVSTNEWIRLNGNAEYAVLAGRIIDSKTGERKTLLPGGKVARLLLLWLCTQAVLSQSRTIYLKPSMRNLLREIGLPWSSQNSHEVANQLQALLACKLQITVAHDGQETNLPELRNLLLADESALWFLYDNEQTKRESEIQLSQELFESLNDAVPLDSQAVKYIVETSKSALALDVYFWLCWRLYGKKKPSRVTWKQLYSQFGCQSELKRFKITFREALVKAQEVYPQARIVEVNPGGRGKQGFEGFLLYPSPDPRYNFQGKAMTG